jgi:ATP-dependent protease ClpP protease subunit
MGLPQRVAIYKEIEAIRHRPLVAYVTSPRIGAEGRMAGDVIPELLDQMSLFPTDAKGVDLLIVSNGGDPCTAWRFIALLRERYDKVAVLIPQSAFSAATLLALGADEIFMHPNGNLGPTDPLVEQVRGNDKGQRFAAEDLAAFLKFTHERVGLSDQEHLRAVFMGFCEEVGHVTVGMAARAIALMTSLGERLLKLHMPDPGSERTIQEIVETLSQKFYMHGFALGRREAKALGLPVVLPQRPGDTVSRLEKLMWDAWLDVEAELSFRVPFSPMAILKDDPKASRILFGPVPQLDVPPGSKSEIQVSVTPVPPVEFAFVDAVLESTRRSSWHVSKGVIQAARTPNLDITVGITSIDQGWKQVELKTAQR